MRTRSPNWFGEGDEKILIDGEKKPSIWGTGTEDYFLQAWGLDKTWTPFFGTPYYDQPYRLIGSQICCYRWHLADPIVFQKGIKVTFEHYGWTSIDENPDHKLINWNEREDDFSSVAYWYQTGEPTFAAQAPSAEQRRLPSIERATVNAKDFTDAKHHGRGHAGPQELPKFYDQPQLYFKPADARGGMDRDSAGSETQGAAAAVVERHLCADFGRYQAILDGVPVGEPMDFYAAEITGKEFPLLDSGPNRASTSCGWSTAARTSFPTAYRSARIGPSPRASSPRRKIRPRQGQGLAAEPETAVQVGGDAEA